MATPRSEGALFLRDLALLLGVPLVLLVALLSWWKPWLPTVYLAASPDDAVRVASGTWDWVGRVNWCRDDPETITFSADHRQMIIADRKGWKNDSTGQIEHVAVYDIQDITRSRIRGLIRGESRKTDAGQPVVWDLMLRTENSFAWHRTDWAESNRTKSLRRCPAETRPVEAGVARDSVAAVVVADSR
jgi:hypothetical protein